MLGKYLQLFWIKMVVAYRNMIEFMRVVARYYPNREFGRLDRYLLRNYLLVNPYKISKQFLLEKKESQVNVYGETPLTTLELIATECNIQSDDVVYELGSGRARTCFWLRFFIGCRVVGIEQVPTFVKISQHVRRRFGVKGVKFMYQDFLDADYTEASVIYFYGTCSETSFIRQLINKLKKLPTGTKIITISYPLANDADPPLFKLIKNFPAKFTWGEAMVYLQEIT